MGRFIVLIAALATLQTFALRVVSTSPQTTEILFQLGKGSDIVATVHPSTSPPQAVQIPSLGPLYGPNVEKTVMLSPDFVVLDRSLGQRAYQRAVRDLNQHVFEMTLSSLEDLHNEPQRLLRVLYGETKNPQLEKYQKCLHSIRSLIDPKPFRFLVLTWFSPAIAFGHQTFLSDLISQLGGINILPTDVRPDFPRLSLEWLLKQAPDIVYFITHSPEDIQPAKNKALLWWPIKTPRLIPLKAERFARASFTPLSHLTDLELSQTTLLPRGCREL